MRTALRGLNGVRLQWFCAALGAAAGLCFPGAAPALAEELTGYVELTHAQQDSTADPLTGAPPVESGFDTTYERVNLTFRRALWPNLHLLLGGYFDRVLSDFEQASRTDEFETRRQRPFVSLRLQTGIHVAEVAYDRLVDRLKANGVAGPEEVRETFSASLGWRPDERSLVRLQYFRTNSFDEFRTTRDQREDSLQLTVDERPTRKLRLLYRGSLNNTDNRVEGVKLTESLNTARVTYGDSVWRRRMNINADYTFSYRATETISSNQGEIGFRLYPATAGSSLDDFPEDGVPTPNPALIDENRADSAGINIGAPPPGGDDTLRNMALDFGVDTQVNSVWVWLDREVRLETAATFSWTVYTSPDNNLWTPRQVVTNAPISSFDNHIELRFASVTTRYLKVVVAPLAASAPSASDYPSILVTELEAYVYVQAAAVEVNRHSATHRLLYDMRTRLVDSIALYHDLSLQWNRAGDSPAQWFLTNGLSMSRALNSVYTASGRVAREDGQEAYGDYTSQLYSASLSATPVETLRYSLTFSGRKDDFEGEKQEENTVFLYALADLYRGVSVNVNLGRSFQTSVAGERFDTTRFSGAAAITPHPSLTFNLIHQDNSANRKTNLPSTLRTADQASEINASFSPLATVYLYGSHRIEKRTSLADRTIDNYAFSWSPFPYGALRFNINYNETDYTPPEPVETVFTQSLRWSIRRRSFFDLAHQKLTTERIDQKIETDTYTGVLHLGF